jgi:hypothetical protein
MVGRAAAVLDDRAVEPRLIRYAGQIVVGAGSGRPRGLGQAILQRFADEDAACVVSDAGTGGEGLTSSDAVYVTGEALNVRGGEAMH